MATKKRSVPKSRAAKRSKPLETVAKATAAKAPAAKPPLKKIAAAPRADPALEEDDGTEGIFPIVGVGASAGGLEAFTQLLQALPENTGMGFVFVQHLDPEYVSILTELLQRHTKMPVQDATEGIEVRPNHIYIIPRNKHLGMSNGVLTLTPRVDSPTPHMPIDPFLRSLAQDQKSKAVGVILSGNASDGALGMMAVKAAGGITFAQSSETAKYDGMTRAAISTGCVDFVLSPPEIGTELGRLGRHPYIAPTISAEDREPTPATLESIGRILALLRGATGVDFTYYKSNTIRRRILRRMALKQAEDLNRYIVMLRSDPQELQALYEDILINVTEFFRDPEVFERLKKDVFPNIVPSGRNPAPIRIWVPGCASGEEVYSIAMTLLEYLGDRSVEVNAQIFGTDISDGALEKARHGIYRPGIVQNIAPERLRRFFTKVDASYQIGKRVREMCVFAKQNLVKDPPFSRIDFVSCRNVLIYLDPVLQKRVIPIFHYALKPSGYLLLGSSEAIGTFPQLFSLEDGRAKIYRRRAVAARSTLEFPAQEIPAAAMTGLPAGDWSGPDLAREADRMVLGRYSPAGVVIDDDLNVLQFRGKMAPFLEPTAGMASLNLLRLAKGGISLELRNAVQKAKRQNGPVRREGLRIRQNSGFGEFNLEVIPFKKSPGRDARYLILFHPLREEVLPVAKAGRAKTKKGPLALESENVQLRQELAATKEYLQSVIEELESSNEELRAANEEIQSSNEELQSTNEELETSKEELQSTNEELNTANEELQTRNGQLSQVGNDLLNLLGNVNIPIIMVGNDLRIRRFTPISQRLLNLIPTDVGRPITDINLNLDIPEMDRLVAEVIETLSPKILDVKDLNGRSYSLRIRPYRTEDNKIDGAVIVLVDMEPTRAGMELVAERAMTAEASAGGMGGKPTEALRAFGAGLLMAQENERRHLALELHDDLSQRLALLELNVETMEKGESPPQLKAQLRSVHGQITTLAHAMRKIAYQLHPAALEQLGLGQAMESFVHEFGEREHIQTRFQALNLPGTIDQQAALCLYRIAQESLRNVAQHANAKSAEVILSRDDDTIQLRVKDSGSGFDCESVKSKGGLGLRSMEERARACGGTFKLSSQPGAGTEMLVEIPEKGA